jgi:hypothetical protein
MWHSRRLSAKVGTDMQANTGANSPDHFHPAILRRFGTYISRYFPRLWSRYTFLPHGPTTDSFQSTFSGNWTTKSRMYAHKCLCELSQGTTACTAKVKQYVVQYFSEMTAGSCISDDLVILIVEPSLLSVTREVQPVKG